MRSQVNFMEFLAGMVIISTFGLILCLIFIEIPPHNAQLLNILVGIIVTLCGGVINYYFGSSKSSSDKNKIIFEKRIEE